jgi:hypothetical protein
MSQHDFIIANQNASGARTDINNGLQSLASNNSGASAPSTTYANMFWYDTANNLLKIRNEGNSAWINVAYIDQSNNLYKILDNTIVSNTSGTQTGLIGDQTTSTWNTGTGTTESLVSPAKVKSAITNNLPTPKAFAEAYVTYSGSTPTTVDSYGISGVSRVASGDTAYTFSTAQPDTDYIVDSHYQGSGSSADARIMWWLISKSTTGFTIRYRFVQLAAGDYDHWVMARRLT